MVNALEMQDDGTSVEVCINRNSLTSDSVLWFQSSVTG